MNFILCDFNRDNLKPFTLTRPVAEIRIGILTIREKWKKHLGAGTSYLTEKYLSGKFPLKKDKQNICINASVLPGKNLVAQIKSLKPSQQIVYRNKIIAACISKVQLNFSELPEKFAGFKTIRFTGDVVMVENTWDIFLKNEQAIKDDFDLITKGRKSAKLSATNKISGQQNIFIERGVKAEHSIINATAGPVYIGEGAEIMEGSIIRGPFALCEHATLKMGAKIYGATTIGPYSKVGGEVINSVIFGYSNKAHDGFLGNSVIGEWCNLGADTNNSNLKNNYSDVKVWSYEKEDFVNTGLQFCGIFMADHSKCGINTMFNTGTIIGVSSNIFGGDFPPKFIPSFSWGGAKGFEKFNFDKAVELATAVYKRRNMKFGKKEIDVLKYLYEMK
ncbi:MAG: GlmU family protein [Bacteroidia bacterium]